MAGFPPQPLRGNHDAGIGTGQDEQAAAGGVAIMMRLPCWRRHAPIIFYPPGMAEPAISAGQMGILAMEGAIWRVFSTARDAAPVRHPHRRGYHLLSGRKPRLPRNLT